MEWLTRFGCCSGVHVVALKLFEERVVGEPVSRHVAGSDGLQHAGLVSDESPRDPFFVGGEVGEEGGVFEEGDVFFGVAAAVGFRNVWDQQGNPEQALAHRAQNSERQIPAVGTARNGQLAIRHSRVDEPLHDLEHLSLGREPVGGRRPTVAGKVQVDALPPRAFVEDRLEVVQHVAAVARPAMDEEDRPSLSAYFTVDGDSLNSYLHSTSLLCHDARVTTDTPATSKPRRALVWWGVGLMLVGVLLGVAGGAFFIGTAGSKVIATFTAPVRATPADFTIDFDEGKYVVYELTGATRGSGQSVTITPSAVEVISASGVSLPVEATTITETVDRGNGTFTGAARFTVVDPGVHSIKVLGNGQQIIVAPSIAGSFGSALAWLGLVGIGALVAFIGLVLLIVGLVRGRRPAGAAVAAGGAAAPVADPWNAPGAVAAPAPALPPVAPPPVAPPVATPAAAPPGWFPDPKGEARLRWWDGGQWTDNVS